MYKFRMLKFTLYESVTSTVCDAGLKKLPAHLNHDSYHNCNVKFINIRTTVYTIININITLIVIILAAYLTFSSTCYL